jgi:carbonic anhydrase/acetyltransferase-like protein (isoleucine patch superfamily)
MEMVKSLSATPDGPQLQSAKGQRHAGAIFTQPLLWCMKRYTLPTATGGFMILPFEGNIPRIASDVWIAPTAAIIGDVTIGAGTSVWFGAVIRGDLAPVVIGAGTNIQDNVTIHVDEGFPVTIGDDVTIGHNAVVHGCTVETDCLVGMGSVVLNGARLSAGVVVAAGSVVRMHHRIEENVLVAGAPAAAKKTLSPKSAVPSKSRR